MSYRNEPFTREILREEGSGTREVFAESLGFYDSSTGRDLTTGDALQAENGEEVITLVEENAAAIGYVSAGMLNGQEQVHAVTVDGSNLERNFYVAHSGKLSELETDFLTYVEGSGQEVVGEHYTAVGKVTSFLSGKPSGIYDLGMASRDLKDYEKQLLDYKVIAKDEIAVVVQKDNSLQNITSDDLKKIYTGDTKEWKELGE